MPLGSPHVSSGGTCVGVNPAGGAGGRQRYFQHAMVKSPHRCSRIDLDRQFKNTNDFIFLRAVPILCEHVLSRGSLLPSEDGEAAWLNADFNRTLFEKGGGSTHYYPVICHCPSAADWTHNFGFGTLPVFNLMPRCKAACFTDLKCSPGNEVCNPFGAVGRSDWHHLQDSAVP